MVRAQGREVHGDAPVDLIRRSGRGLDTLQHALPGPVSRPQPVPFVDRFPRFEVFWQVTLLHPSPCPIQVAVDAPAVVPPPAAPADTHGQERPQLIRRLDRGVPMNGPAAENEFCRLICTAYASVIDDTAYPNVTGALMWT